MTTSGWRALVERRIGRSTVSGSSAVRGLRGVMRLDSEGFETLDGETLDWAVRAGATGAGAAVGATRAGACFNPAAARSLPPGGGLDAVTATYPLLQTASSTLNDGPARVKTMLADSAASATNHGAE
jgi:hypothetical protein